MGRRASVPSSGPALRVGLLLLLLLGQPGGICSVLCAQAERAASAGTHPGHHHTSETGGSPCHRLGNPAHQVHELLDATVLARTPVACTPLTPLLQERNGPPQPPLPYPVHPLIPEPPPPRA
jgi:hypothetical protein